MKVLTILLLFAIVSGLAAAGEPEKKKAKESKAEEKAEVITNETLSSKYGKPAPPEPGKPVPPSGKEGPAAAEKAADGKGKMTDEEREKKIAALKAEEDRLNRRIGSLKNPFLPKVPPTAEEKKAEEGKGADERVRMLEARLVAVRQELQNLQTPAGRTP